MKRIQIFIFFILFALFESVAQQGALIKEINEQVWKPFIQSFNAGDDEAFKAVHSKDVIRVNRDGKEIYGYDRYFQKIPDSVKAKWSDWKKNIELRFIQRIAGNDKAFEEGYYKSTSTNQTTGEVRKGIGKFHVVMRKENGVWKILVDADTNEGANEELFSKAKSLE
jgi:ketosteroid isomerase-like protein